MVPPKRSVYVTDASIQSSSAQRSIQKGHVILTPDPVADPPEAENKPQGYESDPYPS